MVPGEFVNCRLNCLNATLDPHGLSREVGVSTSAVPVASHWFGVKIDHHAKIFSDSLEEVSADPEVVTHVNALGGSYLVLPLGRHHLSIGSRHPDTSIETGSVVSFHNVPAIHVAGTNSAVVRALGSRETILGPSEGVTILVKKGVLLLNSKPWVVVLGLLHNLCALLPLVSLSLLLVVLVRLTHHHDVLATSEGVWVEFNRVKVGIRVGTFSLVTR